MRAIIKRHIKPHHVMICAGFLLAALDIFGPERLSRLIDLFVAMPSGFIASMQWLAAEAPHLSSAIDKDADALAQGTTEKL